MNFKKLYVQIILGHYVTYLDTYLTLLLHRIYHMTDIIINNEANIRLGFFFGTFMLMGLWEVLSPRRELLIKKSVRWLNNISLLVLNIIVIRLIFPTATIGMVIFVNNQGWGLFNYFNTPFWITTVASIVLLDLVVYLQHVMVHAVPLFWRLHRLHHTDQDYDITTGTRFHPIEILLSMLVKFGVIIILGPSILAVIIFEIFLNVMAMFNHSNINIPIKIDAFIRLFVVTPDMHRVHHSVEVDETNSNYGFNISLWDRLFGTYLAQPKAGHIKMKIGLNGFEDKKISTYLPALLMQPLINKKTGHTINERSFGKNANE